MSTIDGSGFTQFDRLLELVRRTRELLDSVAGDGELPEGGAAFLEGTTLPHLEGIQVGFQGWLRADTADADELRYLLLQLAQLRVSPARSDAERRAAAAEALAERRLADGGPVSARLVGIEPWHLAALTHARVVLASIPKLPEEAVRFPAGRRTYGFFDAADRLGFRAFRPAA